MAEAMVGGILHNKIAGAEAVFLSDHKAQRCEYLEKKYHVAASVGSESFIRAVDILFLAIKPQAAKAAMEEISGKVGPATILVSVVAGLTTEALEKYFPVQPVIRVMPNTPVAVGEGMSALAFGGKMLRRRMVKRLKHCLMQWAKPLSLKKMPWTP